MVGHLMEHTALNAQTALYIHEKMDIICFIMKILYKFVLILESSILASPVKHEKAERTEDSQELQNQSSLVIDK